LSRLTTLYRASAALVAAAMLAGCGAQAIAPTGASAALQRTIQAASAVAVDVDELIAEFKALEGFGADAMKRRAAIVAQLGDSDDDEAMAFLQAEYENLAAYPEAVRPPFEMSLVTAIDALDTYDESLDEPIIAEGPGAAGSLQEAAYLDAMARKKRKKGLGYWLSAPFRWVGNGLRWLVGAKPKKKKKRRKPRPKPDPGYPTDPSVPGSGY
jgi:hypothetical protein